MRLRILGVDTDGRTIPHEVGWIGGPGEGAVHLDKGCYRGQETVARVHNLGKPPRMLVLLHLDGSSDRPATGDPVLAGLRSVGRLGTVVDHVDEGPIALALLKRGLPADTELTTGGEAPLDKDRTYRIATNDFMARGGDGYTMFRDAKPLLPPLDAERRPVRDHASWLSERALARRGRHDSATGLPRRRREEVAGVDATR